LVDSLRSEAQKKQQSIDSLTCVV